MGVPKPESYTPLDSIAAPTDGFPFTPTDATWIQDPDGNEVTARAVTIEVAGDLDVTFINGQRRTIPEHALPVGGRISMQIKKIWAANTTATGIFVWV
jgi:hypothetical protein